MADEKIERGVLVKNFFRNSENLRPKVFVCRHRCTYGDDVMSRARVFEWHERFREGREKVDGLWPRRSYFST